MSRRRTRKGQFNHAGRLPTLEAFNRQNDQSWRHKWKDDSLPHSKLARHTKRVPTATEFYNQLLAYLTANGIAYLTANGKIFISNVPYGVDQMAKQPDFKRTNEPPIGYRSWLLGERNSYDIEGKLRTDYLLLSLTAQARWEGPVFVSPAPPLVSQQQAFNSNNPSRDLGIHCWKTKDGMISEIVSARVTRVITNGFHIFGEIYLSGTVIEHEYGYRSQRATVKELHIYFNNTADIQTSWESLGDSWVEMKGSGLIMPYNSVMYEKARNIRDQFEQRYQCDCDINNEEWIKDFLPRKKD